MNEVFRARLETIQVRIDAAARRSGRRGDDITLVAVTKTHPQAAVEMAYAAGLRDFGENRVEALRERQRLMLPGARWHMLGHIQSRKVKTLAGTCDVIHSIDRVSLAEAINRRWSSPVEVLLQLNVSGEESKGGWRLEAGAPEGAFLEEIAQVLALPHVRVRGLMTMAPYDENPEQTRPIFARLRTVQQQLQQQFPDADFSWLSMGMTNDFEIAIEEGATHVRIGTALFGERASLN